jgi:Tfp pilus assembly protein PilF
MDLFTRCLDVCEAQELPQILHSLGLLCLNRGTKQMAIFYFSNAIKTDASRYTSWVHLAYAQHLHGDDALAVKSLKSARQLQAEPVAPSDQEIIEILQSKMKGNK